MPSSLGRRIKHFAGLSSMTNATAVNIGQIARPETAMRESAEYYRTTFDLGPVAIYSIDAMPRNCWRLTRTRENFGRSCSTY